jgi:nicotinate-nucleotide adenylyltransferase
MRVAVYGGSFNPPHVGHAMVAAWVLWTQRADQVWLVPTAHHAFSKELAPFELRVRLCQALARTVGPGVHVSDIESRLPTPSYTFNTLSEMADAHPDHSFRLVLGSDNLDQLHAWHRWADVAARFDPLIVGRVGYPDVPDAPSFPGVSSTRVRAALAAGEPVAHLVPAAVLDELARSDSPWSTP